jgi:small subunit ribosomal protein S8
VPTSPLSPVQAGDLGPNSRMNTGTKGPSMTDPIADMLTRIRNAQRMGHEALTLPASKLKQRVAEVLATEGYVQAVQFQDDGKQGSLTITLKYGYDKQPAINELKRVSRPGRRVYVAVDAIPRVKNGLGIAVLSTSRGVVADRDARKNKVGGELLCTVW